jgi:hypothetical protein
MFYAFSLVLYHMALRSGWTSAGWFIPLRWVVAYGQYVVLALLLAEFIVFFANALPLHVRAGIKSHG